MAVQLLLVPVVGDVGFHGSAASLALRTSESVTMVVEAPIVRALRRRAHHFLLVDIIHFLVFKVIKNGPGVASVYVRNFRHSFASLAPLRLRRADGLLAHRCVRPASHTEHGLGLLSDVIAAAPAAGGALTDLTSSFGSPKGHRKRILKAILTLLGAASLLPRLPPEPERHALRGRHPRQLIRRTERLSIITVSLVGDLSLRRSRLLVTPLTLPIRRLLVTLLDK